MTMTTDWPGARHAMARAEIVNTAERVFSTRGSRPGPIITTDLQRRRHDFGHPRQCGAP